MRAVALCFVSTLFAVTVQKIKKIKYIYGKIKDITPMNYSPQQLQRQRQMKKTTNNTVLPELVSKNLYRPMTTVLGLKNDGETGIESVRNFLHA